MFALVPLARRTRLIEYCGERISHEQADRRYENDDDAARSHTFLFIVDDEVVIDATYGGNSARFINHSCNPNCEAVIEDGRVFIETVRRIEPGEELTYDYGLYVEERYTPALKKLYACGCGARNCRGTMLAPKR